LNKILPKEIKNLYRGHPIAFWGFIAFLTVMTWRSIIHLAYQKYGLHEIANFIVLTGDPDPMPVVYLFFSLWGLAQLIFCLVCWIVVFRYRELISLMYILFISEWCIRLVFYPLIGLGLANNEIYNNGSTPGSDLALWVVIVLIALFLFSVKESKSVNSKRAD
jgi:hypothetical protein